MIGKNWLSDLHEHGFTTVPGVLREGEIEALRAAIQAVEGEAVSRRKNVYAIRNLLEVPLVRELAQSAPVRGLVEPVLGSGAFAVRGIFFDKTPDTNWKVVWHQDMSIAVREKREVAGFGAWSQKAGIWHVQPPREVLENMVAVRLHLDPCPESNGALRVVPNSHTQGKLDAPRIAAWRGNGPEITCEVPQGGALLMRPLLLHASSPSQSPAHRRVVHLEFGAVALPGELQWHDRV